MTDKLRIAVVAPSIFPIRSDLAYGGLEYVVHQQVKQLVEHGHEVTLIACKGSDPAGGTLFETIAPPAEDGKWTSYEEWEAFEKYEFAFDYGTDFDVVHDHSHMAHIYRKRMWEEKMRLCHTCHGIQTWNPMGYYPHFAGLPNLLTLSEWHRRFTRDTIGFDSRTVIHGIDTEVYKPCPKEEVGDYWLVLGLMAEHKGHVVPLKHWEEKILSDNVSMGRLIVAGEDKFVPDKNYVTMVKELCEGPGKTPVAEYVGSVDQAKKLDLLQHARGVFLPFIPSQNTPGEAWSLIIIEAQACGTPVITTPNGAIPELVEQEKTGIITDRTDLLEPAMKACEGMDRDYISKWASDRFNLNKMYESYMRIYQDVLRGELW
jgi:glycosyltransferase involved in cell wall biosynthesis